MIIEGFTSFFYLRTFYTSPSIYDGMSSMIQVLLVLGGVCFEKKKSAFELRLTSLNLLNTANQVSNYVTRELLPTNKIYLG
jgi:hypothetical protein